MLSEGATASAFNTMRYSRSEIERIATSHSGLRSEGGRK